MRAFAAALSLLVVSACAAPTVQQRVTTQYPPGTGALNENSPFQTLNSLPPGAANLGPGVTALAPDYASIKLRAF